jgi:hypothetical protein
MSYDRSACDSWSKLCSFLAGIFFTCIVLIIQQRSSFPYRVVAFSVSFEMRLEFVAILLAFTFIFYMFAAISYADAVGAKDDKLGVRVKTANVVGGLGFVFTFVSLFMVLLLIGFWVAVLAEIVAIGVFVYLKRHR